MGIKHSEDLDKEYQMNVPDLSSYKDLHGGMQLPKVGECRMEQYFKTVEECLKKSTKNCMNRVKWTS